MDTTLRSDLAVEICNDIMKHNSSPDGIKCSRTRNDGLTIEEVVIENEKGARLSGKPVGKYLTVSTGKLWLDDAETFKEKVFAFRNVLRDFIAESGKNPSSVLVAGLGNERITADAIGPATVEKLIVTRHIKNERPSLFTQLGLFDLCAATPGVLGQTGIESAVVIRGISEKIRPEMILAIDALASRDLGRLVNTIQLCNTGIRPGSGVGNARPALLPEEMGIPVISIGVPTVVDAATLAADAIGMFTHQKAQGDVIRDKWSKNGLNFFVTPKETDQIISVMAAFIGFGINLALNQELSYEDMLSLIG
ncbi:MAG: GPR endopeptidase [Clostridia bacterium]|nr:GPR endopeptidase [Clostridia bacterium]